MLTSNIFISMKSLICRFCTDELATDVTGAEALLEQHQEHRTEIDARSGTFQAFELFSQQLVEADIIAHEDRINGMNELENSGQLDSIDIRNKENISMRYKHIQDLAAHRQALLNEAIPCTSSSVHRRRGVLDQGEEAAGHLRRLRPRPDQSPEPPQEAQEDRERRGSGKIFFI